MARTRAFSRSTVTLVAALTLSLSTMSTTAVGAPQASPKASHPDGHSAPRPGASGIGDRLYPTLGNGGYDALHYDLDLRYATSAPDQGIDGTVTMRARATQSLSRFDLDFSGQSVGSVTVNGRPAQLDWSGEELVITPKHPIRNHSLFWVRVKHFRAEPSEPVPGEFLSAAFFTSPDGSATAGQPNMMHSIYPSNDHPRDKASFSFRFDVPAGITAVANGVLVAEKRRGDRATWVYVQRQPMATELTQLVVGAFGVVPRGRVDGVAVRDVVPTRMATDFDDSLPVEREHLRWLRERVGRYPFDVYGSLVMDSEIGFALETQTLSLYPAFLFQELPRGIWDPVMLHEAAHQWFGDSVAPWEWSDVWLNEGHASWYEYTYAEEHGFLADDAGFATLEELMRDAYSQGDAFRRDFGPVARPLSGDVDDLFSAQVYLGGALVLYALRQKVGQSTFERIERAWVHHYRGRSASTWDFIRLASAVSGQDLRDFLTAWLYDTTTPPMPGHPDWTVAPAPVGSPSARSVTPALRGLLRH
jgi:aminopeptidase N